MQGKVEICGVNTAKLPVLKAAETRALLEKARSGDREARQALIAGNLRLVLSVIQKFSGRGESREAEPPHIQQPRHAKQYAAVESKGHIGL